MYSATITDLLRLLVVPVFGWAAIRDIKTRRVPNETWLPLAALGIGLLCWDAAAVWTDTAWRLTVDGLNVGIEADPIYDQTVETFLIRTGFSVGFLVPFAYAFWWFGGFGGADAKALMTLAVLFPIYPVYYLPGFTLPWFIAPAGVFSLTILANTVLGGALYPLALGGRNLLRRAVSRMMIVGRPLPVEQAPRRYGRLLERPDEYTRKGLDLDVLRMYLSWRGLDFEELQADPKRYRDPATLPDEPNDPGDGTIEEGGGSLALTDGGEPETVDSEKSQDSLDGSRDSLDDPWGAEAFFEDIGGPIYGTDAEELQAGLTVLTERDQVWYSPGIPFIVPMFVGLVLSLTAGDILVRGMLWLGLG
ncbi:MAG: prepilin peptidase [Halapricum sp.]